MNDNRFCKATAGPNRAGISMDHQSRSVGTVSVHDVLSESERTLPHIAEVRFLHRPVKTILVEPILDFHSSEFKQVTNAVGENAQQALIAAPDTEAMQFADTDPEMRCINGSCKKRAIASLVRWLVSLLDTRRRAELFPILSWTPLQVREHFHHKLCGNSF